jgi:hypothetical protein
MVEPVSDKHYEEKFEFPLLKLIRQRAEEKDISYLAAAEEVVPEYAMALRYRDTKYNDAMLEKQQAEIDALIKTQSKK